MGGKEVTVLAVEKEQEQECSVCGPTAFWRSEIIKRGRRHMIPMISRITMQIRNILYKCSRSLSANRQATVRY